jgi:hypothetical protein
MGSELNAVSDAEKKPEPARHTTTQMRSELIVALLRSVGSSLGVVVHFAES